MHAREIRLLHMCIDPHITIRNQTYRARRAECRHRRDDQRTGLQRTDRCHDTGERRAHDGVIELTLRFGDGRLRLHDVGKTIGRQIGIAVQPRERYRRSLIE